MLISVFLVSTSETDYRPYSLGNNSNNNKINFIQWVIFGNVEVLRWSQIMFISVGVEVQTQKQYDDLA